MTHLQAIKDTMIRQGYELANEELRDYLNQGLNLKCIEELEKHIKKSNELLKKLKAIYTCRTKAEAKAYYIGTMGYCEDDWEEMLS
jgi:hypothetical protein